MSDLASPELVPAGPAEPGPTDADRWEPVALRRPAIEREIERLSGSPRTDADLRRALVVHPRAGRRGRGLAPGIQVSIEVLGPGEVALPPRRNSSGLALQLRGTTQLTLDGEERAVGPQDVYNVAPRAVQRHINSGSEPAVRLYFSNAALLELLGVHHVDVIGELREGGVQVVGNVDPIGPGGGQHDVTVHNDGRVQRLGASDAWRLEYERLIDPPWVPFRSWLWPWKDIESELERMGSLDHRYLGRRICLLYDPATGRTNGTTSSLFASMCIRPAGIIDRPHRHTAAAVNYFLAGSGWSTIDGRRIDWDAGDLIFIAPGWATHHHASGEQPVHQLAVQDNPLHLAMGSLVWQEDLAAPPRLLGAEPGFTTGRHEEPEAVSDRTAGHGT
jgi:gentisate 1,2-dioxygenase